MQGPGSGYAWLRRAVAAVCVALGGRAAVAQTAAPVMLSGVITDPSGAQLAHVPVHVQSHEAGTAGPVERDTQSDATGRYTLALPPGVYDATVLAPGFEPFVRTLTLSTKPVRMDAKLTIATQQEQVEVSANSDANASTAAADSKTAIVFKGSDLISFSNDDATFQQELLSLAGGSGQDGAQLYVDGFSNGRFPPKSSIREVRINENPYTAQYDQLGFGRVEIFTKPGADSWHGEFQASGNDQPFNAANPYAGAQPPYHSYTAQGNVGGPLDKKTSVFVSGQYNDQQNNSVVVAQVLDPASLQPVTLSESVSTPQSNSNYSARFDRQMTANDVLTARYEFNQSSATGSGVGLLVLPAQGLDTGTTMQTLQLENTQTLGAKLVAESRFQYIRTRLNQSPVSSAPGVVVQGAFSDGGSSAGVQHDNQDQFEFQEYTSLALGAHFLRIGARYRLTRESNLSSAGYNGQYTFPSLTAYQITRQGLAAGETDAQIRATCVQTSTGPVCGGATQFTLTAGQLNATILSGDLGAYAEDEWKLRKTVTVDYGLRFESQSAIPDHADFGPRIGVSWAAGPFGKGAAAKHDPLVVLRAGAGIFYLRFPIADLLTTVRQNGVTQQSYIVTNPSFFTATPGVPPVASLSGTPPTPYTLSPHLHATYQMITGLTAERALGKIGHVTATYYAVRGLHWDNSLNINAPLPGTYNPAVPGSGVRPLGGQQNLYQFASDGLEKSMVLAVNANLHPTEHLYLWGYLNKRQEHVDTAGATSFPSQPYNVKADYGPGGLGYRGNTTRLYAGANEALPFGFSLDLFVAARTGQPFNITTGTDLNGDTIYNDRPAFATAPTANSMIYKTKYGTFDANPQPGEAIIPYDYARAPGLFFMELGITREFKFGPRPAPEPPVPGAPAPKKPAPRPDPRYDLFFTVDSSNVLNHVNRGVPVGVLSSPFFGQSISLEPSFSQNNAANRMVFLQTGFRF